MAGCPPPFFANAPSVRNTGFIPTLPPSSELGIPFWKIYLDFAEAMDTATVPPSSAFQVSNGSTPYTPLLPTWESGTQLSMRIPFSDPPPHSLYIVFQYTNPNFRNASGSKLVQPFYSTVANP